MAQQSVHPTIKYGPLRNECATWMHADVLLAQDDLGGSEPKTGTWPSWWATHGPSNTIYWVDVLYDATGQKLKATPNNPDPAVWTHLATHFQCQFQFREPENGAVTAGGGEEAVYRERARQLMATTLWNAAITALHERELRLDVTRAHEDAGASWSYRGCNPPPRELPAA